jgi:phage terminase small subunit
MSKAGRLTEKQERFCQQIVLGVSQGDAYRAAYDAGGTSQPVVQNKASALMKRDDIRMRIDAIRKPVVTRVQYTLEKAMDEAEEALQLAREMQKAGQMVAAIQLRAKLNGLLVDKVSVDANIKGTVSYKANMPPRG